MAPVHPTDADTLQRIRKLIRGVFTTRDELYAAAETLDDNDLAEICRRLAEDLGGNAADLQQFLQAAGAGAVEPTVQEQVAHHLQEIVIDLIGEQHGTSAVLGEAEAAEQRLKSEYDRAIDATPDIEVEGLLRRQRRDVAFGETVLHKVGTEDPDVPKDSHRE